MGIFASIPNGGIFEISGERYRKTGPATYVSVENPILGEYTIQPYTEARIKVNAPPAAVVPAPVKKAVVKKPAPKKVVKKAVKPVKKTVAKKVVAKKRK